MEHATQPTKVRSHRARGTAVALAAMFVLVGGCRGGRDKGTPTTASRASGTVTTLAVAAAHDLTLDQFVTRFSHDPAADRSAFASSGFVSADADPVGGGIVVFQLRFQGRDGAAETMSALVGAAQRRPRAHAFNADEIRDASGVQWFEGGRSTGAVTVQQVLFVRETTLVIVEAAVAPDSADTAPVRAAAKRAATG